MVAKYCVGLGGAVSQPLPSGVRGQARSHPWPRTAFLQNRTSGRGRTETAPYGAFALVSGLRWKKQDGGL
jgi:hypothetical protein